MFNAYSELEGFEVRATDGAKGTVDDIYFDDAEWTVRYLVVGIGFWLLGRSVLLGAETLKPPEPDTHEWPVNLSREEVEQAADPETDAPVGEQMESRRRGLSEAWPPLVMGPAGGAYSPMIAEQQILAMAEQRREDEERLEEESEGDPHLRSMKEVRGYDVAALDGEIGTVADFLVNPLDWRVRYLVVDTGTWLPGRRVALATDWITEVDWLGRSVSVNARQRTVETSPEVGDIGRLQRSDEEALFRHYDAPPYWGA